METKKENKAETVQNATDSKKEEPKKSDTDFKAEAKKTWASFVRFVKPYGNLNETKLLTAVEPKLQKHIDKVYLIAICVLGFLSLYTIFAVPGIGSKFLGLLIYFGIFLLIRLTCELIKAKK